MFRNHGAVIFIDRAIPVRIAQSKRPACCADDNMPGVIAQLDILRKIGITFPRKRHFIAAGVQAGNLRLQISNLLFRRQFRTLRIFLQYGYTAGKPAG